MTRLWQVLFRKSHLASLDLHHDRHQARGALLRMPLLTLEGRSFASRVSANLFSAAGLSEHIAHTPQDHAEKLIELTNIPVRLQTLRKRLEKDVL
jgi:predicted O-linked N-acetylglucosamine transferase (SPINDLY family)